ncbi:MAG: DUF2959 family protein [Desulfofustis sp.]
MIRTLSASLHLFVFAAAVALLAGCGNPYYSAMEKVGIHKRDIMVDRVEDARNAQADAQKQFSSALEQFDSVVSLEETDLKKAYDKLNGEYDIALVDTHFFHRAVVRITAACQQLPGDDRSHERG